MDLNELTRKVIDGHEITRQEALFLYEQPVDPLCGNADRIREFFCGDTFDMCTIINAKSGRCSENCKFCAQSSHNNTNAPHYELLSKDEIISHAIENSANGVARYSIVTSGKRLSASEIKKICGIVSEIIKKTQMRVCVSLGLLGEEEYALLKTAGVTRVHNNLETSRDFFARVCTTHTFDDKIRAIKAAQKAGLAVCSGGIMGLGETVCDRIDMALCLREHGILSVPINMLNPIAGTPFKDNRMLTQNDMRRIVAVYRFILPKAYIRLAGGRGLMSDKGKSCFKSGANAAITGDMLTTAGITVKTDYEIIKELGFKATPHK